MRGTAPILAVAVLAAGCGGSSDPGASTVRSSSPTSTASTDLEADFDVGGRTMHLVCAGPTDTGEPTILLEAGGGGDHLSWARVLSAMDEQHRLCAYDRAGLGESEPPGEASRTAANQADDLHALLDAAGIEGPFVLGAHSDGGMVATMFTYAYPDDVAGLLFVDPRGPRVTDGWLDALGASTSEEPASVAELRDALETFETDPSLNPEHLHLQDSFAEAASALGAPGPLFGDRPVIVLSAEDLPGSQLGLPSELVPTIDEIWAAGQQWLADESTAGTRETVQGAGHEIQNEEPSAVVEALERILAAVSGS